MHRKRGCPFRQAPAVFCSVVFFLIVVLFLIAAIVPVFRHIAVIPHILGGLAAKVGVLLDVVGNRTLKGIQNLFVGILAEDLPNSWTSSRNGSGIRNFSFAPHRDSQPSKPATAHSPNKENGPFCLGRRGWLVGWWGASDHREPFPSLLYISSGLQE